MWIPLTTKMLRVGDSEPFFLQVVSDLQGYIRADPPKFQGEFG